MIAKKNPKLNFEKKRLVIFQLGLLTTTAAVLAAFTYQSPMEVQIEKEQVAYTVLDYMIEPAEPMEIPKEVTRTTAPEKPVEPIIVPFTDPTIIDLNQKLLEKENRERELKSRVTPPGGLSAMNIGVGGVNKDVVIDWPDKEAAYIGGFAEMQQFIIDELNYPQEDIEMGSQGTVYLKFVIEKDGSISHVEVERGVSTSIDREAKRIVSKFPKWIPGEKGALPVRTRVSLPITFTIK